jgi:hypothetical protein
LGKENSSKSRVIKIMVEGWCGEDYLILFEEQASSLEAAYALSEFLPGYRLVGLRGWDDFIVADSVGGLFTVPTVPLSTNYLEPLNPEDIQGDIKPEPQLKNKIKWYIQPLIFGGEGKLGNNLTWVTVEQHTMAVKFWNERYRDFTQGSN